MSELLLDLIRHSSWADAVHWKAFEQLPKALGDSVIYERLHHIHMTQTAFLQVLQGRALSLQRLQDFANAASLKSYAREVHTDLAVFATNAADEDLERMVTIPWFNDPPMNLTVAQALTQVAMHSHYHRAQNATRFRELGGKPPHTDLIVWYWHGSPPADWGS